MTRPFATTPSVPDSPGRTLFCADFADYPCMFEAAMALTEPGSLIVGGQGRQPPQAPADAPAYDYFDWRDYYRLGDFTDRLDPAVAIEPEHAARYDPVKPAFMRALDRVFLAPQPYAAQERLFYESIRVFEAWISRCTEGLVVCFAHAPHFPWHLAFHAVCRVTGTPVYILRPTQISDTMLVDACLSAERQLWVRPARGISADWAIERATRRSPRLANAVSINRRAQRHAHKRLGVFRWLGILWRHFRDRYYLRERHYYRLGWSGVAASAIRRDARRRDDLMHMEARALRERPAGAYVYFSLHYQPERTTVPEAGYFHDQIRAIRLLAAALPADLTLAVKEHPRQLGDRRPSLRRLHTVRRPLYDAIEAIPNARLIHAYVDSAELIRDATLTASCNGSAVFEGLQVGVPGVTFAATWHSDCDSAPFCSSAHTLAATIHRLRAKSAETVRADFLTFIERNAGWWFLGAHDDRAVEQSELSRDTLRQGMTELLAYLADSQTTTAETRLNPPDREPSGPARPS